MAALLRCLQLPALDIAHDDRSPTWIDAFTARGPLAGRRPDVIICAGLARRGKAADFTHAEALLKHLMRPFDSHPAHIWPVPGPGDRDGDMASPFLAMAGGMKSEDLFGHPGTAGLMIEPFSAWNAARERLAGAPLTAGAPWVAYPATLGALRVAFFGLNTAWLDAGTPIAAVHRAGDGLAGLLGRSAPDLIIGALHHPPEAIHPDEQVALTSVLERCDIVLHDSQIQVESGPPIRLGVAPGVAHWIEIAADAIEVEVLDVSAGLRPSGPAVSIALPRAIARRPSVAVSSDGPPDLDGYLGHIRREWGTVLLHGLVDSGETDESQPVGEVYVSLRVNAPRVAEPAPSGARPRPMDFDGDPRWLRALEKAGRDPADPKLRKHVREGLQRRGLPSDDAAVDAASRRVARVERDRGGRWLEDALTAFDVEQAVAASRWMLLEGDPGTGKTTTVQAVVMALVDTLARPDDADATARARAMGFEPPWPLPMPIYFRRFWRWVNDHVTGEPAGDDLLVRYLAHRLGGHARGDDWIRPTLEAGRALLIFDGLDEMPWDMAHEKVINTISGAADVFGANRCLVTSRPAGLLRGVRTRLNDAGLVGFRLRALAPDQIDDFVGNWYGQLLDEERARAEAADLVGRIRAAELHELAEVPITLVAMAVVHRNRRLPERRVDLYEQCIRALLHRWHDRFRDQKLSAHLCGPLTEAAKVKIVERLALLAHGEGGDLAVIDRLPVLEAIHETLPDSLKGSYPSPEDCAPLIESLSERSGLLLREPGSHGWKFRHRAFQEYLAARRMCHEHADDDLIHHLDVALDEPDWHGVIPLALAYKATSSRASARVVLTRLLERAANRQTDEEAVAATAVLGRAVHDLRHYDLGWLSDVMDPHRERWAAWLDDWAQPGPLADRITVAEVLGAFGDPRLGWGPEQFPLVPAGPYIAGAIGPYIAGAIGEKVHLDHDREDGRHVDAYRIGRFPVTMGQFLAFVDHPTFDEPRWWSAGRDGETAPPGTRRYWRAQPPSRPATRVTWYEAMAFCRWATEHVGHALGQGAFGLPTDAEWEKAARGGSTLADGQPNPTPERLYPWADGAEPDAMRANFGEHVGAATPVGLYPSGAGPYGAVDQAGNVWEWCDARPERDRARRVVRGGAWGYDPRWLPVSSRLDRPPAFRLDGPGFRCVWRRAPRSSGLDPGP